jgi:hypothetical protein
MNNIKKQAVVFVGIIALLLLAKADFVTGHVGHDPSVVASGTMYNVLAQSTTLSKTYKIQSSSSAFASQIANTIGLNTNITVSLVSYNLISGTISVSYSEPGTKTKSGRSTDSLNFYQFFNIQFSWSSNFHGDVCVEATLNWVIASANFTNPTSDDIDPITNVASTEVCVSR